MTSCSSELRTVQTFTRSVTWSRRKHIFKLPDTTRVGVIAASANFMSGCPIALRFVIIPYPQTVPYTRAFCVSGNLMIRSPQSLMDSSVPEYSRNFMADRRKCANRGARTKSAKSAYHRAEDRAGYKIGEFCLAAPALHSRSLPWPNDSSPIPRHAQN